MVGIKDIAKEANVSISTVSYALNNSTRISEATRNRIQKIAQDMNYVPNLAGVHMRKKHTNIISVHLNSFQGTFYGDLLDGMNKEAKKNGMELVICSGEKSKLFLPQKLVDGAIILDRDYSDEDIINFADKGCKLVVLDREFEHNNVSTVLLDNFNGSIQVAKKIHALDITKVYVISGPKDNYDSKQRLKGIIDGCEKYGIELEIIAGDFSFESGRNAFEKVNFESDDRIAIYALNDEMAIGFQNKISGTNIKLNEDVFLFGFDNIEIGQLIEPKLKSITYSKHKWGSIAVDTLIELIHLDQISQKIIETKANSEW